MAILKVWDGSVWNEVVIYQNDHGTLSGLSDNDHPQYVLSSTNATLSSTVTSNKAEADAVSSTVFDNSATWATDNDTTDHTALSNIGTRTHPQLDDLYDTVNATSGTWGSDAVDSVNTKTGVVVLDPDDLDDTATTNNLLLLEIFLS